MAGIPLTVPAIEKLLDYLAIGVGAIAGPLLAPWRASREGMARVIAAKADAEVGRIQAAGEGSTSQLIADAQDEARGYVIPDEIETEPDGRVRIGPDDVRKSIEFQATKRVANLRSIADQAAEALGDIEVPDHDPDPDWTARFFDGAQEVSSGDLQKLWARILAGEVETPGRTSLRTLSILRNMTQEEARDFSTLMRFRIGDFIFAEGAEGVLGNRSQRLTIHFSHFGLFAGWGQYQQVRLGDDGKWWIEHYGHALFIEGPPGKSLSGMEDNPLITVAGREIAALCQHEPHLAYLSHFADFLKKQGCELKMARILARVDEGFRISPKLVVEPLVEARARDEENRGNG